ncbi:MAG TPA: hypothetical protein VKV39_06315 [Candidatus Sulfotelmatobacter sp.]|nr:hypothetical protein [Candidatus Sulfotelmatobacter sp.]
MTSSRQIRAITGLAGLLLAGSRLWCQESPSLGEVARETRKDHSTSGRVSGKQLLSEEDDGPDSTGLWRLRTCVYAGCYELSISLPKSPKWIPAAGEPRRILIPVQGYEEDASHAIRIYAAEGLARGNTIDVARRTLLQSWFARPEYFGQGARLTRDEHSAMNATSVVTTRFTIPGNKVEYRGTSVVANAWDANHAFACVFREDDADTASSICDAIINSAQSQVLLPPPKQPRIRPYHPPQYYPENDPADDPPQDAGDDDAQ